ncbi:MAG: isopenicillin N synthase family oxygenase [Acidimicrobiales bacterium]|nr:isopenicillin N synthase family oxygenase [Acidimicrobiales bacterium]
MASPLPLPTIDLQLTNAVDDLRRSFAGLGFAQLVGHEVSRDASSGLRAACDDFFAAPEAAKVRHSDPDPLANRGYRAKGAEALSYSLGQPSPPDLFESFNCGADDRVGSSPLLQPTPWPDELAPAFRTAAHAYLIEMEHLAQRLDQLVDEALGLALFASSSMRGPDTMACINYTPGPAGDDGSVHGQQRMGAHSDYTTFTILEADPVPGLQIVDPHGRWSDVIPEPGALLVNVGDVLAMTTNDRWPSTLHRVVPMHAGAAAERRSIAYFHYPDLDVEIVPHPSFVSATRPARYRPTTIAAHLAAKLAGPKVHRPSSGPSTVAGRLDDLT